MTKNTWNLFPLTRFLRGATGDGAVGAVGMVISTHTPLARRDFQEHLAKLWHEQFLLTRLLRGATKT